jgi:glucose-1-phosphate cytidylyltransferase
MSDRALLDYTLVVGDMFEQETQEIKIRLSTGKALMKVVILAGGLGTRISEESHLRPKPMIEIGEQPILWHIMKLYSHFGFNEFVICCGYKQHIIKEYFADYYLHRSDITFDFSNSGETQIHHNSAEPWVVTVVDTGLNTMTGGRVKRIEKYTGNDTFMLTYGDGVCNVDLCKLLEFHQRHGRAATITAIQPTGRFGVLNMEQDGQVHSFTEKPEDIGGWINGGFMVLEPCIFDLIDSEETILEKNPFETLARLDQMMAYRHNGFWQCMDTQRDKQMLEALWASGEVPWKLWS